VRARRRDAKHRHLPRPETLRRSLVRSFRAQAHQRVLQSIVPEGRLTGGLAEVFVEFKGGRTMKVTVEEWS
jgi:hypothetical protein